MSNDKGRSSQRGWSKRPKKGGYFGRPDRPSRPGGHDRRPQERDGDVEAGPLRLFGLHAVEAALRNPARKVIKLTLTENAERRLAEALGGAIGHPVEHATPRDLDRILGADTVHQGVMLETEPLPEPEFSELIATAAGRPLIVLDQVTDPHNVCAILRSGAAFGAAGLVLTRRHNAVLRQFPGLRHEAARVLLSSPLTHHRSKKRPGCCAFARRSVPHRGQRPHL